MSRRSWLVATLLATLLASPAAAHEGVAVIATHVVTTRRRTINKLPLKRIITTPRGWSLVTSELKGAPPQPNFAKGQACVLVVADLSGGAKSWIDRIRPTKDKLGLRVRLVRQPGKPEVIPHLKCVFLIVDAVPAAVDLQHQTRLEGGVGTITTLLAALPSDAKPEYLPQLGPDLRLRLKMKDGSKLPAEIKLRHEVWYPGNNGLPDRIRTVAFPSAGLPFPRILTGRKGAAAKHLYAAHAAGLRTTSALQIKSLPRINANRGCRPPLIHNFELEPIPGSKRGR